MPNDDDVNVLGVAVFKDTKDKVVLEGNTTDDPPGCKVNTLLLKVKEGVTDPGNSKDEPPGFSVRRLLTRDNVGVIGLTVNTPGLISLPRKPITN